MKRNVKNVVALLGATFSLSGCANKAVFYYNQEVAIYRRDKISYNNFQRLDSHAELIYEEGFKNVYDTYEEAMAYKTVLEEHVEEVTDKEGGETYINYQESVSFFSSLTPEMFNEKKLFVSDSWIEMSYNQNSCRLEGIYLKDNTLYIHRYCDYKYKAMSHEMYRQCYTFFIDKSISFASYKTETTDLFKY